jgi:hypothetical protein
MQYVGYPGATPDARSVAASDIEIEPAVVQEPKVYPVAEAFVTGGVISAKVAVTAQSFMTGAVVYVAPLNTPLPQVLSTEAM